MHPQGTCRCPYRPSEGLFTLVAVARSLWATAIETGASPPLQPDLGHTATRLHSEVFVLSTDPAGAAAEAPVASGAPSSLRCLFPSFLYLAHSAKPARSGSLRSHSVRLDSSISLSLLRLQQNHLEGHGGASSASFGAPASARHVVHDSRRNGRDACRPV